MIYINDTFKALSDANRRKILRLLKNGDMTASEIAGHFKISKPSISHHLNLLKKAKLVIDERYGQYVYYSLNTTVMQEVIGWLSEMMGIQREEEQYGKDQ